MKKILIIFMIVLASFCVGCSDKENTDKTIINLSNKDIISNNNDGTLENKSQNTEDDTFVKSSGLNQTMDIPKEDKSGVTTLKFKNTNSNETIRALNGKKVSITGYLSTLSPLNGEFAYLMNMPYQSCPFCVPGTSSITNTLTIVAGKNSKIEFTDLPVTVVGTLEIGNFKDEFDYEYDVRLNDVTVTKADVDKLSNKVKQYNLLAENGVVGNIYSSIMMLDFSVFFEYYDLELPQKVSIDEIKNTKSTLVSYNSKGEYNNLVTLMDDLIKLGNDVNQDVEANDYSKFNNYKNELQNVFYTFAEWMAEGEL